MRVIDVCPAPRLVVWDITYACPLRCSHCYSESGRRAAKQLGRDDLLRVADALIAAPPDTVVLAGGEPLIVKEIFEVAERLFQAGIGVILYTGGWGFEPRMLPSILALCSRVTVSIDGATADVHDRIRGRSGSFDRALLALTEIDRALARARMARGPAPALGVDFVVMRSNWHQLAEFCRRVAVRAPELSAISFGAVIPTGLGSRTSFAELELLSDEDAALMASGQLAERLQTLVPASVQVSTTDNRMYQMHPDSRDVNSDVPPLQLEPDGRVRAMPIYEGTVGSLLEEPLLVLWERAIERWSHPFVVDTLRPAVTAQGWAEATRRIDLRFGSADDVARIARRPPYAHG